MKRHEQWMKDKVNEIQDMVKEPDIIKAPLHYSQHTNQPVDFIMSNRLSFWAGNVIKYVARAGTKMYPGQDPIQSEINDINKAIRYCEMRLNQLFGRNPSDQ